ncbi:hypothetical protein [Luteibacter rhizovicinus]|uniref:hypothetical protein n=1 Tax=Luteibacter rhizovicinus TaxID=242606 RepID=UPI001047871B|nr:hypothetical protein [Luteibacter rhizovicinus]
MRDEVTRLADVERDYRGCIASADDSLKRVAEAIREVEHPKNVTLSILLVTLGGDYVSGTYAIVGRRGTQSFVYDGNRQKTYPLLTHTAAEITRATTVAAKQVAPPPAPSSTQVADHVSCTVIVDLTSGTSRLLSSLSDNAGLDSTVVSKVSDIVDETVKVHSDDD